MQNSIYKIKYLLFLSWDWEAWCLTQSGRVIPPPPKRNTAWNKGRKCFYCLGAPNNLIRPWLHGQTQIKFTTSVVSLWSACKSFSKNKNKYVGSCSLFLKHVPFSMCNNMLCLRAMTDMFMGITYKILLLWNHYPMWQWPPDIQLVW